MRVVSEGKTGVEMEALTGASVAALTLYDMCKSYGHEILISQIRLVSKLKQEPRTISSLLNRLKLLSFTKTLFRNE